MTINTSLIGNAMVHIDEAISDLESLHNSGIDEGATKKLRHVYDWLECTREVLEGMK